MPRYSDERRAAVLTKLLPPYSQSISAIADAEGICRGTLYNWRKQAQQHGLYVPEKRSKSADNWSGESKLAAVLETAGMNAEELSAYCRNKGLYPKQITEWKQACIDGATESQSHDRAAQHKLTRAQQKIRVLEKQLRRKDKALAESAALLVLQKKFQALWEDEDE